MVWAKNVHDSSIGKHKTRGVVRPLLVPVVALAKGPRRCRLVLPDDGLRGYESSVTTTRPPTDGRGRNNLQIHSPWPELSLNRRKKIFFAHPGAIRQGPYFTPAVKASFWGGHNSNFKFSRLNVIPTLIPR